MPTVDKLKLAAASKNLESEILDGMQFRWPGSKR